VPALARAIPLGLAASFEWLNLVGLWATGVVLFAFLRASGLGRELAAAGSALFVLSAFAKFVLWYRYGVDQLAVLAVAGVALATVERRFALAACIASVGALGKESVLLLAPATWGALRGVPGRGLRTLALWAPPVAVGIALRVAIPHTGPGLLDTIAGFADARLLSPKALCEIALALPKTFGAMPLVALLLARRTAAALRADPGGAGVIALCVLAGVFGATDYERVYFLAFPFAIRLFLRLLAERPPTPLEIGVLALAQASLLDVFARPDFFELGDWFMVNTSWAGLGAYAAEVAFWTAALWAVGFKRVRAATH
jgi:hypothetical protein